MENNKTIIFITVKRKFANIQNNSTSFLGTENIDFTNLFYNMTLDK